MNERKEIMRNKYLTPAIEVVNIESIQALLSGSGDPVTPVITDVTGGPIPGATTIPADASAGR
jgi:fructose/tagatose bisphosphate aldolase